MGMAQRAASRKSYFLPLTSISCLEFLQIYTTPFARRIGGKKHVCSRSKSRSDQNPGSQKLEDKGAAFAMTSADV